MNAPLIPFTAAQKAAAFEWLRNISHDPTNDGWPGHHATVLLQELSLDHGMNLNAVAFRQYDWVERMGWHNKTVLEALALICSEVGEAVNECRGPEPTAEFGTELADIILRTLDLARWQGINIEKAVAEKMAINEARGTRGRRI
jgi:NTP pyrophosphatase (non-canonical NTP hydrolase)